MRRLVPLLLALLFVFCGCRKDKTKLFAVDGDGYGVTDPETGVHYAALDPAFEPLATGEAMGKTNGTRPLTLYAVADVDPARALADEEGTVYLAGDLPDLAALSPDALLVCERDAASVVLKRFADGSDLPADLYALWRDGEETALPTLSVPDGSFALRWLSPQIAGLSYGVSYLRFAESAYLYDLWSKRTVAVPAETAALLGI